MSKLRKKRLLAAFATFLALMILTKSFSLDVLANGSKEQLFNDVTTDHWAYKQITSIGNNGIIKGYGDGTFRPGDKVTRAHAAVMIVNALKLDYVGKVPNFSDVPSEHWAAEHIAVAQETGIIKGYKDGTFKPGENITRGQISVMVVNAFNLEQKDSYKDFSDVPSTHWAYKHIEILASNGIINGYRDGSFGSGDLTTRAHFSVILSKAVDKEASKEVEEVEEEVEEENEDILPAKIDLDSLKITKEGAIITIDFECIENSSGLGYAEFIFCNEEGIAYDISSDYDIKETSTGYQVSTYKSRFTPGIYTLNTIKISDKAGNSSVYNNVDYSLEIYQFDLSLDDFKIPGVDNIDTSVKYTNESIDVNVRFNLTEDLGSVENIILNFSDEEFRHGFLVNIESKDIDENGFVDYVLKLNKNFPSGIYKLNQIDIRGTDRSYEYVSTTAYPEASVTIQNEKQDIVLAEIDLDSIEITKEETRLTIDFDYTEGSSELKYIHFIFYNEEGTHYILAHDDKKETSTGYQLGYDISQYPIGIYKLRWVDISDKAGNFIFYELPDCNLKKHQFEVSPDDDKKVPESSILSYGEQVVDLVNKEREAEGLLPLTMDSKLTDAANKRSMELLAIFSHQRPDGSEFHTVFGEYGVNYGTAGENIACGQPSPQAVVSAWMNSPGHRANILRSEFKKIGVGVHIEKGTIYWTQLFTN